MVWLSRRYSRRKKNTERIQQMNMETLGERGTVHYSLEHRPESPTIYSQKTNATFVYGRVLRHEGRQSNRSQFEIQKNSQCNTPLWTAPRESSTILASWRTTRGYTYMYVDVFTLPGCFADTICFAGFPLCRATLAGWEKNQCLLWKAEKPAKYICQQKNLEE